ncbi:MAG: DUF2231 domain-containing protein [Rufibacter sp.]
MKLHFHPPHLMLIHFPSALFPTDFVCAAFGYYQQEATLAMAAFYALAGGVLMGWGAVIFGFADLVKIPEAQTAARQTALLHGGLNTVVLLAYTVLFFLQWKAPQVSIATMPVLVAKALLLLILFMGNYLGGQLVLKHKIGTIPHP